MAKAATAAVQTQASQEDGGDSPLIDTLGGAVKTMITQGKEKGYVTYDDLNKVFLTRAARGVVVHRELQTPT